MGDSNNELYVDTSGEAFQMDYEPTKSIEKYENHMIRFGHSKNLTAVFAESASESEEAKDYMLGLIFVGAIILGFFLLWAILLMIFMCMAPQVGFLSGFPFVRKLDPNHLKQVEDDGVILEVDPHDNHPSQQYDQDYRVSSQYGGYAKPVGGRSGVRMQLGDPWKSRPTICRLIFILCGLTCITFGFLLVTMGVTNLQTTVNTIDDRAYDLNQLAEGTVVLIRRGMRNLNTGASAVRNVIVTEMGNDTAFCPSDPSLSNSQIARELQESKDKVIEMLDQLDDFQDGILGDLESSMKVIADGTGEVMKHTSDFDMNDWQSLIVVIPYTVIPSFLIVAALLAMFDVSSRRYSCFINWFILPIFIIMTTVAFVIAASMSIAAGVNSDFCLPGGRPDGSPDETILAIMEQKQYNKSSIEYRVASYYISQCDGSVEDPWLEIRQYGPELDESIVSMTSLLTNLTNNDILDVLAVYCNRNFDLFEPVIMAMIDIVTILKTTQSAVLDIARCGRLIPLYTDTTYKAGCEYAPSAVFWVFYSSLILGVFGMGMITTRSAMKMSVVDPKTAGHSPQGVGAFPSTNYDRSYPDQSGQQPAYAVPYDNNDGEGSLNSRSIYTSNNDQSPQRPHRYE